MAVPVDPAAADLVALANPSPPAAPVPAVVDAVLPAPPAPHVPPAGAAGGQQGQFNEVVFWFCVFFSFVLVFSSSYLHRLCVVSFLSHEVSLRVSILLFITYFFTVGLVLYFCFAQLCRAPFAFASVRLFFALRVLVFRAKVSTPFVGVSFMFARVSSYWQFAVCRL